VSLWTEDYTNSGDESITSVGGAMRLDLPDKDSGIRAVYQYAIPSGDFDVRLSISDYVPDDNSNAPDLNFRVQDGYGANRAMIRYKLNADGSTHEIDSNLRDNNNNQFSSVVNPSSRPTLLRIRRSGNVIYVYYFDSGWTLIDSRDFGTEAAYLDEVAIELVDNGDRGGYADVDDLTFTENCPTGSTLVWTTSTTTTTTTTTTEPPGA